MSYTAENYIEFIEWNRRDKLSQHGLESIAKEFRSMQERLKNLESSSRIMSRSLLPIEERIVIFSFKDDDKERIEIPEIHRDWKGKIDVEKLLTKYHKALIAAENDS